MMATSNNLDGERSVSIGRIFGRAFGVMGHNPLVAFGIAFLFGALPGLIVSYLLQGVRPDIGDPNARWGFFAAAIIGGILSIIFQALVQGALVRATLAESQGVRAGFGECVADGLSRAIPLIVVAILVALGVGFGMLLLLVPGIILAVMWGVVTPLVVAERAGVGAAFRRSRELTKGARWKIFGLYLLVVVIFLLAMMLLGVVTIAVGGVPDLTGRAFSPAMLIFNAVTNTLFVTLGAVLQTSLYVELRNWKDGPGTQALGDIFG